MTTPAPTPAPAAAPVTSKLPKFKLPLTAPPLALAAALAALAGYCAHADNTTRGVLFGAWSAFFALVRPTGTGTS